MNAPNDGGWAFPCPEDGRYFRSDGMTLRDWYAGKALEGSLANPNGSGSPDAHARWAYSVADAMIAARVPKAAQPPAPESTPGLTPEELATAKARLEAIQIENLVCSLGDRPESPGVERLREAEELRALIHAHEHGR